MKTGIRIPLLCLFVLSLAMSCKKDSDNGGQNLPTEVVVQLPTAGQIVLNGTNLKVEGTVTDNNVIANVSVQIRNKATGAVLYSSSVSTASVTFYRYVFNWTVSGITASTVATVKVTGKDVGGGEAFKEVDVNLEP
jgi:hypothetical protein